MLYNNNLLKILEWQDKRIVACESSVQWVVLSSSYNSGPNAVNRKRLVEKIVEIAQDEENDVILIKGQDLDSENDSPNKLKGMLSSSYHRILFLHTPLDVLYERCKAKPCWSERFSKDTVYDWLIYQLDYLKKLQKNFDIVTVRSEEGKDYELLEFPPNTY